MNKCESFLNYFDKLVSQSNEPMPEDVQDFREYLIGQKEKFVDKPAFTDSGLEILEYLQGCDAKGLKAKDIAEGMGVTSRKVSGAIRKLCSDGYVAKFGETPVSYSLTENGINFNIQEYKESLKNA